MCLPLAQTVSFDAQRAYIITLPLKEGPHPWDEIASLVP